MEIIVKGVLGALVAIGVHYSIAGKHSYLSGLIVAAPIFALFAHATFASTGRAGDLQDSVQFHLLSLIPTALYLLLVWWLATRLSIWAALIIAMAGWSISALVLILAWNKASASIQGPLNTPFTLTMIVSTLICALLLAKDYWHGGKLLITRRISAFSSLVKQRWSANKPVAGFTALMIGSVFLLTSQVQFEDGRLPGEERICGLLESALTQNPGGATAQQLQRSVFARYVALAKEASSTGDTGLSSVYANRARAVLFGSWVNAHEHKPAFC